jgi:hypothetical protein
LFHPLGHKNFPVAPMGQGTPFGSTFENKQLSLALRMLIHGTYMLKYINLLEMCTNIL